jgi:hypothetical protein
VSATSFTKTVISFGDTTFGKTNYLGIGGRSGLTGDTFRGALSNRTQNKVATMQDGTSNTFLFGEYASKGPPATGWSPITPSWMGAGYFATVWGANPPPSGNDPNWWMLSSRHPGMMMFGIADGSVRTIRFPGTTSGTPTYDTFIFMSGQNDGRVVNLDNL